ncbi:PTS system, nitrogen regulatory IIA component [Devosia crocina]|uniref:PTS system, nitrogen regulatory IIA component n=1 Tax=Devosia crocina TaxID=429728 RepID=A0A1I7NT65_9HYPH|nr:PTS sugar transporter subunit IIA [Devosia crocina]SFV37856.1 PTS system, nitrogen regulatory IIA component [Devosia crocina]
MELVEILAADAVLDCTGVGSKRQLLEVMCDKASVTTGMSGADILAAVIGREELGSTGIGNGIAIPHGKLAGLKNVTAVFARLDEPIEFDAVDDQPVDLVILLLAPVGAGADHLKALSRVARLLRTDSVVESLRRAEDSTDLYDVLTRPIEGINAA